MAPLVSITRPGPSRLATWNQRQPDKARQHFLQDLSMTSVSRGLGADSNNSYLAPSFSERPLSDLSEPQFLLFCKTGEALPAVDEMREAEYTENISRGSLMD